MENLNLNLDVPSQTNENRWWKKWIFPTLCIILIFVGMIWLSKYSYCNTDGWVNATAESVWQLARELYLLQYEKQKCKDNLSALETIEDYNGVNDKCTQNDSLIEKKKIELGSAYEFEYMRIDVIVGEKKENKKYEEQMKIIEGTWTAVEKLMELLADGESTPN